MVVGDATSSSSASASEMGAPVSLRSAFSTWPQTNERLRAGIAGLSPQELAVAAAPGRWPLWAVVGHLACQRVFWLCDFAGEPGAETTPFTNAAWCCPGDDDLESVMDAGELDHALTSSFAIVDRVLDSWTVDSLDEVIERPDWGMDRRHSRGGVVERVFAHDFWHIAEVNEILGSQGLPTVDPWNS